MGVNKLQVEEGEGKEAADKLLEKQVFPWKRFKTDNFSLENDVQRVWKSIYQR